MFAAAIAALTVVIGCGTEAPPTSGSGPRTVVLISLDTLRPDRLGVYGNSPDVSPVIDELALSSVVFEDVLAPAPWTLPSHMSLLTGLDVVAHGVRRESAALSKHVKTLAEHMQEAGFRTAAFTDGGFMRGSWGLEHGFETFDDERNIDGPNGFRRILPRVTDWMEEHEDEDYFLLVHTFDVHAPFTDGDEDIIERFGERGVSPGADDHFLFRANFFHQQKKMEITKYDRIGELLNAYDAGVHEADRGVGEILDQLRDAGRLEDALIIITSDHGESMFDRGLHVGHGIGLTNDEVSIPMVIRFPSGEFGSRRIGTTVDLLDVAPTVLDVFDIDPDQHMQGESLFGLAGGSRRQRNYLLGYSTNTESYYLVRNGYKYISPLGRHADAVACSHLGVMSPPNPQRAEFGTAYKLGHPDGPQIELTYDIEGDPLAVKDALPHHDRLYLRANDPLEQNDLSQQEPELVENMRGFLLEAQARSNDIYVELFDVDAEPPPRDPHVEQQLAQLGYLTSGDKQSYIGMSKAMREALRNPHRAPDMSEVRAVDGDVHELRLALRAGKTPEDLKQRLEDAGLRYTTWLTAQGEDGQQWWPRIGWRIWELVDLGQQAGIEIDQERLKSGALEQLREQRAGGNEGPGAGREGR